MNRRNFLKTAGMGVAGLAFAGSAYASGKSGKPNILIIVTDDQGYADLSAYAHHARDINTPNMDRIARDGMLFTQAYVTAPVCSPSRAGWNTGQYQQRWDPSASWTPGLPAKVKTIAEYLKGAGYATGKIGKSDFGKGYHSAKAREYPLNHGYDEFLGFSAHAHDYFALSEDIAKRTPDPNGTSAHLGPLMHNNKKKSYDNGYITNILTDAAIDYIKLNKKKPFFLTVAYNAVHHLIHEVPEEYLNKFGVKPIPKYDPDTMGKYNNYYRKYCTLGAINDQDMRKYYLANLDCMDDNIGRLLDALDQSGLTENTLIICFADNGGSPLTGACNRPLRGSKYNLHEGGIRVPFVMRWPAGMPKNKSYNSPVSTLGILPTCLEAAGLSVPENSNLDGTSILRVACNETETGGKPKPLFWQWRNTFAVRLEDWKLTNAKIQHTKNVNTSQIIKGPDSGKMQLYNLKDDPAEQNNLDRKHPEKVKQLMDLYKVWAKATMGTIPSWDGKEESRKKRKRQ